MVVWGTSMTVNSGGAAVKSSFTYEDQECDADDEDVCECQHEDKCRPYSCQHIT